MSTDIYRGMGNFGALKIVVSHRILGLYKTAYDVLMHEDVFSGSRCD